MVRVKKILHLVSISMIFVSLIFPVFCEASNPNFDTTGYGDTVDVGKVGTITDNFITQAISVVRTVGVSIALVIIMVIASKYMMSAPGDRADIKKNAIPFIIGAVVLFATSGILGIIADFAGLI